MSETTSTLFSEKHDGILHLTRSGKNLVHGLAATNETTQNSQCDVEGGCTRCPPVSDTPIATSDSNHFPLR